MWLLLAVACRPGIAAIPPVRSVELVAADPTTPAAADLFLSFDRPMSVVVLASDGEHPFTVERGPAVEHEIPLVGLYASRLWTVSGYATDADGNRFDLPIRTWWTPPLPQPFPDLRLRVSEPAAMEPGLTLFSLTMAGVSSTLVLVDADGEVAWWYHPPYPRVLEARVLADGDLLAMWDYGELEEIDWLGRVVRSVTSEAAPSQTTPVPVSRFHHELFEAADGSWITLTAEDREVPVYPASYDLPRLFHPATVEVEPIVAIDPDSGAVVGKWRPDLALDTTRIGYDSLTRLAGGDYDWAHTNAVSDAGDAWVVSLRHQDAIVAVDKDSNSLRWILANPDNWSSADAALRLQPIGDVRWPYHQHAVKWSSDGRVLLFDNGNHQASPWTGQPKIPEAEVSSRIVEFEVDPVARTVAQDWEFALDPPVFSRAMGDADRLGNGDVLGVWAYDTFEGGEANEAAGLASPSIRVVEFDPRSGEEVWDLEASGPLVDGGDGWHSYRAERVAPLHP